MEYFFKRLNIVFADKDHVLVWLQAFALDVISELIFSKRTIFLDKGEDIDGIMGPI